MATTSSTPVADRRQLLLLAGMTALGPFALNAYLPCLPAIQHGFGASLPEVQSTLSAALMAFALAMLVCGPVMDRIGRRPVVLVGMAAYLSGTALCAWGPDLGWLVGGRAVQSIGGAVGFVAARAILADVYPPEGMRRAIAHMTMITLVSQVLAPMLGGWINSQWGWRAVFEMLFAYGVVLAILLWRGLPETHRPVAAAKVERPEGTVSAWYLLTRSSYLRPMILYALLFAPFMVFVSLAPHLLEIFYGRSANDYARFFPFLILGYFSGNWVITHLSGRKGTRWFVGKSLLIIALAVMCAFVLVWVQWRSPLAIFIPWSIFCFGQGLALPMLASDSAEAARPHTATAWSVLGFCQQAFSALCVQGMTLADNDTPYAVLAFSLTALLVAAALHLAGRRGSG